MINVRTMHGWRAAEPVYTRGPWAIHPSTDGHYADAHTLTHTPTGLALGHGTLECCRIVLDKLPDDAPGIDSDDPAAVRDALPEEVIYFARCNLIRRTPNQETP